MSILPVTPSTRRRVAATSAAALLLLTLGACSSKDSDDKAKETTTTEAPAKSDTTEDATSDTAAVDAWGADAMEHEAAIGKTFDYTCTPKGTIDTVWGAGIYTTDSSVCSAAVQVGLITEAKGGEVTIEIRKGEESYQAWTNNGVTSIAYGSWSGSFVFPEALPDTLDIPEGGITWSDSAKSLNIAEGASKTVSCPAGGTVGSVWGSNPFTADSSICTAGVLAGFVTLKDGGTVTVTGAPGQDTYTGSTANGVTSSDYGTYDLSFTLEQA